MGKDGREQLKEAVFILGKELDDAHYLRKFVEEVIIQMLNYISFVTNVIGWSGRSPECPGSSAWDGLGVCFVLIKQGFAVVLSSYGAFNSKTWV